MAYQITISEKQAGIIQTALELYSRIHMGQFDVIVDQLLGYRKIRELSWEAIQELRDGMRALEPVFTGLSPHAYYGIHSDMVSDNARVAWDLQQVVRNRLAWDNDPAPDVKDRWKDSRRFGVQYDDPMQSSEVERLATISRVEVTP